MLARCFKLLILSLDVLLYFLTKHFCDLKAHAIIKLGLNLLRELLWLKVVLDCLSHALLTLFLLLLERLDQSCDNARNICEVLSLLDLQEHRLGDVLAHNFDVLGAAICSGFRDQLDEVTCNWCIAWKWNTLFKCLEAAFRLEVLNEKLRVFDYLLGSMPEKVKNKIPKDINGNLRLGRCELIFLRVVKVKDSYLRRLALFHFK